MEPFIEVGPAKRFSPREVFIEFILLYITVLFLAPLLAAFIVYGYYGLVEKDPYLLLCAVIQGCVTAVLIFFAPALLVMNPYIRHIVNKARAPVGKEGFVAICQLSLVPCRNNEFGATNDDLCDLGRLYATAEAIGFIGERVQFVLPFSVIQEIRRNDAAPESLWQACRVRVFTKAYERYEEIELAERSSNNILQSQRLSRAMHEQLLNAWQRQQPQAVSAGLPIALANQSAEAF